MLKGFTHLEWRIFRYLRSVRHPQGMHRGHIDTSLHKSRLKASSEDVGYALHKLERQGWVVRSDNRWALSGEARLWFDVPPVDASVLPPKRLKSMQRPAGPRATSPSNTPLPLALRAS